MSRYADKQLRLAAVPIGVKIPYGNPRQGKPIRLCTKCKGKLHGHKGHGFVSTTGRAIFCSRCVANKN